MADRLTKRGNDGEIIICKIDCDKCEEAGMTLCTAQENVYNRLAEFEDAEENGLLVRLLPVDTHVFIIEDGEIFEFRVYQYSLLSTNNKNVHYWAECVSDENEDDLDFWQDEIGECVFLTREEAERKRKENT